LAQAILIQGVIPGRVPHLGRAPRPYLVLDGRDP